MIDIPVLIDGETSVYVIGRVHNGNAVAPSKIGLSAKPLARLCALQSSSPEELILFRVYRLPNRKIAIEVEQCFHATHKDCRLRGEWFDIEPVKAAGILALQIRWALQMFADLSEEELNTAYRMVGVSS